MKKLIVIEGPDRIGKTTLISKLIETGKIYSHFNFPEKTGSPIADLMKKMLCNSDLYNTHPLFKSLLFSVDRLRAKDNLRRCIISGFYPSSPIITCDRYTYSNIAYQIGLACLERTSMGAFGGKPISELESIGNEIGNFIQHVEFEIMQFPKPDLVICLTVGNSDHFCLNHQKRTGDDLNDSSIDLQKFINVFFRSSSTMVKQFNLSHWCEKEIVVIDVLKKDSIEFRDKDDILNQVLREMIVRGLL